MDILKVFLYILVYPGLLPALSDVLSCQTELVKVLLKGSVEGFLFVYSTFVEWVDRKLYAKFQNRMDTLYISKGICHERV